MKRAAQTSALIRTTNPKIRRVVSADDDDLNEHMSDRNGSQTISMLGMESLKTSSAKSSVFARLGAEKSNDKNSSIFSRLGNTSGLDSVNPIRRVTMSGNSINTTLNNKSIVKLNPKRLTISPKKPILPPNSLRSSQTETISVKNRIGLSGRLSSPSAPSRLIVNRTAVSNAANRMTTASTAVLQAKRIAMKRTNDALIKNKTISLRKNIFDRLGPISL